MTTDLLFRASIDGAIAAGVIWLICRLVPSLPAGARAMLWWCAAAKFVVALVWTSPLPVPVLPAAAGLAQAVAVEPPTAAIETSAGRAGSSTLDPPATVAFPGFWPNAMAAIWAAGVAASLIAGFVQWRRARAIVREAAAAPADLEAVVADLAARAGLAAPPPVCVSAGVTTPLVTGLRRATIVVPATTFGSLAASAQRMSLSHEIAHIRRGDLRWGCVPALAEALFFFHPLARLCAREYALWREAACDAAVIEATGAAPEDYAQLLLGLGVTRPGAGLAAAGASDSFTNLKRRLVMLHTPASHSLSSRLLAGAMVGLAVLAIVPVRLTARQAPSPQVQREREPVFSYQLRSREGQPTFVIFRDDATHLMDGKREDLARARQFRQGQEPLIWVRQDGREFVSRDATLLRQLHEAWAPVSRLAATQSGFGVQQNQTADRQDAIGEQQRRLASEQSRLGVQQSEIGLRQSQLSIQSRGVTEAEQRRVEDERAKLQAQVNALTREIEDLTAKMRELERPMRDLSADMEIRSREMAQVAAEMQATNARAGRDVRSLIAGAIASGVLQPVK